MNEIMLVSMSTEKDLGLIQTDLCGIALEIAQPRIALSLETQPLCFQTLNLNSEGSTVNYDVRPVWSDLKQPSNKRPGKSDQKGCVVCALGRLFWASSHDFSVVALYTHLGGCFGPPLTISAWFERPIPYAISACCVAYAPERLFLDLFSRFQRAKTFEPTAKSAAGEIDDSGGYATMERGLVEDEIVTDDEINEEVINDDENGGTIARMVVFVERRDRLIFLFVSSFMAASASNFYDDFDLTWGDQRARIRNGGQLLTLSLDNSSGSGFQSKREYLFGRIDMQLKLVSGNSAGTVTAYYLSSQGPTHDEIDFEFLGNVSGQPYIVHTNVFTQGKGNREQQFYLWFDPTRNFHTYSIVWNPQNIIFFVDNKPIRVFKNEEATTGVPYPKNQPMRIYSSLWNADDWATQGGLVKTDWSKAPFTAFYRNFNANACVPSSSSSSSCSSMTTSSVLSGAEWQTQGLDAAGRTRLRWVQKYYMVYNYCSDLKRFPQGLPPECTR
ncbi:hypothetical protein HYC85_018038 [Camellia sinensis]|uniref:xyloglucan:xyloglucosyl transferase n=2 Tax=Camellia sinensis TaxID=4442 RepID=A0A7J7GVJ4_CAMSI|nr:hypothetical protein HYC85_018038 [Camellia sinensis]